MLKLKLQYFGYLMRRADSFEKTLMLGRIEGKRRRGRQRMRWLDGITDSMDVDLLICLYSSVNEKKCACNLVQGWAALFTQSLSILEMKGKMFNRWVFLKATILCFFLKIHIC